MQAWEQFLQLQENELGKETVQKWLRSLKVERYDACNLYLEAKDSFQALWFEEHIRGKALKLVNGNHKPIKIHLSIANVSNPAKSKKEIKPKPAQLTQPAFQLTFDELDPFSIFSNFVISEDNQILCQLLKEIPKNQAGTDAKADCAYNPFFIYGSTGSGKTHLLMSLTHVLKKQGINVIYVRADTFADHVVAAIRGGEMSHFRQIYRNTDLLIIDDVHIFARKTATQEEFFHTFNTLHLAGKQIVLSANCPPQDLQHIEPRLISRFEWGIVLPLKPLEGKQVQKMVGIKSKALNFPLSPPITEFLLETFTSHPKAITKALEALVLRLHIDARHPISSLTVPTIKTLLSDLIIEEKQSAITPERIVQAVAEHYGLRLEDILGKSQKRDCVLPRQLAMHFCREKLKMPYIKIGEFFSRDHSTVMSGIKQIQKALDQDDREMAASFHTIQKKIQI